MKKEKHWRSITKYGTKKELRFATETLIAYGADWKWIKIRDKFGVGIPKEEYDRIDQKYMQLYYGHKKEKNA